MNDIKSEGLMKYDINQEPVKCIESNDAKVQSTQRY